MIFLDCPFFFNIYCSQTLKSGSRLLDDASLLSNHIKTFHKCVVCTLLVGQILQTSKKKCVSFEIIDYILKVSLGYLCWRKVEV